jgi:hypothetical protein
MSRRITAAAGNARQFNGTSHSITTSAGAFNGLAFDYGTMFVILRWNGTGGGGWREFVSTNGTVGIFGSLTPSGEFALSVDNSIGASSFSPASNTWYFVSWTKLSGSQTPYYNIYDYSTPGWSTANHSGTMANGTEAISNFYIGSYQGTLEYWPGDIAAIGFFRHFLPNNAAVQAINPQASTTGWATAAGSADVEAWWTLNQAATSTQLTDRSGGGANETTSNIGTVITGPAGFNPS